MPDSPVTLPPRRPCCARCTRPANACICAWVTPVPARAGLLILQHPMEVANAKGSARLLHMSVPGSAMVEGETLLHDELHALLHKDGRQPVLLYPELPGERALGMPEPPRLDVALLRDPANVLLVVLDGTWRKSRKMLYQNPLLQALPRLPLVGMQPSVYLIRKAHAPDQLSTLEAACHAMAQLDGDAARYQPLLAAFQQFVAHYSATGGRLDA